MAGRIGVGPQVYRRMEGREGDSVTLAQIEQHLTMGSGIARPDSQSG